MLGGISYRILRGLHALLASYEGNVQFASEYHSCLLSAEATCTVKLIDIKIFSKKNLLQLKSLPYYVPSLLMQLSLHYKSQRHRSRESFDDTNFSA